MLGSGSKATAAPTLITLLKGISTITVSAAIFFFLAASWSSSWNIFFFQQR
jgi:hypothetical protein